MTNGKTALIATAYFHTNAGSTIEHYWGELKASELPAVRAWFDGHVKARGKDLVGAYLYTRTALFKPFTLACHIHTERTPK